MHEGLNGYFQWTTVGKILVDSVLERGAIDQTDAAKRAHALGASL